MGIDTSLTREASMNQFYRFIHIIMICVVFPFSINFYMYFGFIANYTKGSLSMDSFLGQYDHGVYRYRLLGKKLLLLINAWLDKYNNQNGNDHFWYVTFIDGQGKADFYLSFFILNTLFLILTAFVLYDLFMKEWSDRRKAAIPVLLYSFLFAVSQFVFVPYDSLVYFLLIVGVHFVMRLDEHPLLYSLAIGLLMVLGGMTRETITLLLSFYAALILVKYQKKMQIKQDVMRLALFTVLYSATYIGLRLVYGFSQAVVNENTTLLNLSVTGSKVGILFLVCGLFLLHTSISGDYVRDKKRAYWAFMLFSLPYLIPVFISGIWMEIRLFVPIFLLLMILTQINYKRA